MPEEFGTVNLKAGTQQREIELLRRHYRSHREALTKMIGDAPSEHLAGEYQKLVAEIEMAVRKLDELEGKTAPPPSLADTNPSIKVSPGSRPLMRTPDSTMPPPPAAMAYEPPSPRAAENRVVIIVLAGLIVLGIIGYLIWRASSDRKSASAGPVVEQQPAGATSAAPPPAVTPAPRPVASLKIAPASADYGKIRKGTRAVRQFQVTNSGDTAMEIAVARSACRCLFYDYSAKLPAKGQETITVTVDGARAKTGTLVEQIDVHAKKDPSVRAAFTVQATIQ
jgi:hypothetical protein